MNFRPELAEKVMDGTKTVTRRLCSENPRSPWYSERCALKVGRTYAVCPGRGKNAIGRVRILSVERHLGPVGIISDSEARREGFPSGAAFLGAFAAINDGRSAELGVWRIEFEAVPA